MTESLILVHEGSINELNFNVANNHLDKRIDRGPPLNSGDVKYQIERNPDYIGDVGDARKGKVEKSRGRLDDEGYL